MTIDRSLLVGAAVVCAVWGAANIAAADNGASAVSSLTLSPHGRGDMPSLDGAVGWLNSKPLTASDLRGKVVLVEFWTYTCINWQRTLPQVRAWAEKYRDKGLIVIGVHTPEFSFERDLDNVRRAVAQLGVGFPVAVDSGRAIWRNFDNRYWPALYFIDAQGMVRHTHFGEGDYARSERIIQHLLAEAGARDVATDLVRTEGAGSQADADWASLRSTETYVGHDRAEGFVSPGGIVPGRPHRYSVPERMALNTWALSGEWQVQGEAARLERPNGRIVHRFHARDLHLVMGPTDRSKAVPFRVLVDGHRPGAAHGADVDAEGRGMLTEQRLYQLIRQSQPIVDRRFEIEFLEPGAEAFSFTFG